MGTKMVTRTIHFWVWKNERVRCLEMYRCIDTGCFVFSLKTQCVKLWDITPRFNNIANFLSWCYRIHSTVQTVVFIMSCVSYLSSRNWSKETATTFQKLLVLFPELTCWGYWASPTLASSAWQLLRILLLTRKRIVSNECWKQDLNRRN